MESSASGDVRHKHGGGGRARAKTEASEGHEGGGGKHGRATLPRFEQLIRYEKHNGRALLKLIVELYKGRGRE